MLLHWSTTLPHRSDWMCYLHGSGVYKTKLDDSLTTWGLSAVRRQPLSELPSRSRARACRCLHLEVRRRSSSGKYCTTSITFLHLSPASISRPPLSLHISIRPPFTPPSPDLLRSRVHRTATVLSSLHKPLSLLAPQDKEGAHFPSFQWKVLLSQNSSI